MPNTAIVSGVLLILIGIIGFISTLSGEAHYTALIPAGFGILLVVLGSAAKSKENLRIHLMHAAVLIGLIGLIAMTVRLLSKFGGMTNLALGSHIASALVFLFFVILCVKSFIDARRNRVA